MLLAIAVAGILVLIASLTWYVITRNRILKLWEVSLMYLGMMLGSQVGGLALGTWIATHD